VYQDPVAIPIFPRLPARALGLVPLGPLSWTLTRFSRQIAKRHPGLFRRLGNYARARFILDPTDLPLVLCLEPNSGAPRITLLRHGGRGDARIAGPLAALLGLVHGAFDGDALFFSRDLVIEGDTAAVLALRNAIDDAELDLAGELGAVSGPLQQPLERLIALGERATGVALTRREEEYSR
jgi:O2-independent ubiquinone biosynthesis accessory factor UbiT